MMATAVLSAGLFFLAAAAVVLRWFRWRRILRFEATYLRTFRRGEAVVANGGKPEDLADLDAVAANGFVDYSSLLLDPSSLEANMATLQAAHPDYLKQNKGFLINSYNIITMWKVLEILRIDRHWKGNLSYLSKVSFFTERRLLAGRWINLNDLENKLLRPMEPPDARIHFAINCASFDCPRLVPQLFSMHDDTLLDAQLEERTLDFINRQGGVRLVVESGGGGEGQSDRVVAIKLSKIFQWYASDFGGSEGVLDFVRSKWKGRPIPDDSRVLEVIYVDYCWELNAVQPEDAAAAGPAGGPRATVRPEGQAPGVMFEGKAATADSGVNHPAGGVEDAAAAESLSFPSSSGVAPGVRGGTPAGIGLGAAGAEPVSEPVMGRKTNEGARVDQRPPLRAPLLTVDGAVCGVQGQGPPATASPLERSLAANLAGAGRQRGSNTTGRGLAASAAAGNRPMPPPLLSSRSKLDLLSRPPATPAAAGGGSAGLLRKTRSMYDVEDSALAGLAAGPTEDRPGRAQNLKVSMHTIVKLLSLAKSARRRSAAAAAAARGVGGARAAAGSSRGSGGGGVGGGGGGDDAPEEDRDGYGDGDGDESKGAGTHRSAADRESLWRLYEELLSTERSYLADVKHLVAALMVPLREDGLVKVSDLNSVFSNLEQVCLLNEQFLAALPVLPTMPATFDTSPSSPAPHLAEQLWDKTAAVLARMMPFFRMYSQYCGHFAESIATLERLRSGDKALDAFVSEKERVLFRGMPAQAWLIKPVQRMCKYPLFLRDAAKYLRRLAQAPGAPEGLNQTAERVGEALEIVQGITQEINQRIMEMGQLAKLMEAYDCLDGADGTLARSAGGVGLLAPGRRCVHYRFVDMSTAASAVGPLHHKRYVIFVFNDFIAFARPKREGVFATRKPLAKHSSSTVEDTATAAAASWNKLLVETNYAAAMEELEKAVRYDVEREGVYRVKYSLRIADLNLGEVASPGSSDLIFDTRHMEEGQAQQWSPPMYYTITGLGPGERDHLYQVLVEAQLQHYAKLEAEARPVWAAATRTVNL